MQAYNKDTKSRQKIKALNKGIKRARNEELLKKA
jgi:hypothetical protein